MLSDSDFVFMPSKKLKEKCKKSKINLTFFFFAMDRFLGGRLEISSGFQKYCTFFFFRDRSVLILKVAP